VAQQQALAALDQVEISIQGAVRLGAIIAMDFLREVVRHLNLAVPFQAHLTLLPRMGTRVPLMAAAEADQQNWVPLLLPAKLVEPAVPAS
jgi:hypothetical protein